MADGSVWQDVSLIKIQKEFRPRSVWQDVFYLYQINSVPDQYGKTFSSNTSIVNLYKNTGRLTKQDVFHDEKSKTGHEAYGKTFFYFLKKQKWTRIDMARRFYFQFGKNRLPY